MPHNKSTIPQVLYNTPDPFSKPSELYVINATTVESASDAVRCWFIKEEHGYWDEKKRAFKNRATTLQPNEPHLWMSFDDAHKEINKQVMCRVREGFKYQLEWNPFEPPFFSRFEIQPDGTKQEY